VKSFLPSLAVFLLPVSALAQTSPVSASARAGIDAGNQAWVDGVKSGDVARILATYAPGSVDCSPNGKCFIGLAQIGKHMKAQMAASGRPRSAAAHSWGAVQHGNLACEWGHAEADFDHVGPVVDTYLTVWQKQPDGSWKIFRNLVMPKQ
jgi:ketosteroid isomerase-like protein